jgi:hypothetical protein
MEKRYLLAQARAPQKKIPAGSLYKIRDCWLHIVMSFAVLLRDETQEAQDQRFPLPGLELMNGTAQVEQQVQKYPDDQPTKLWFLMKLICHHHGSLAQHAFLIAS